MWMASGRGFWGHQGLLPLLVNYKVPSINNQRPAPGYSRSLGLQVSLLYSKTIKNKKPSGVAQCLPRVSMNHMIDLTSHMTVLSKTKKSFLVTLLRHQVILRLRRMFWSTLPWFELLTMTEDPNRLGTGINVTEKDKRGRKQHWVLTGQCHRDDGDHQSQ